MKAVIHTDGGARGNPGPAAIGYEISVHDQSGKELANIRRCRRIGETTNNVAEYVAVQQALMTLLSLRQRHGVTSADLYADSQLIVEQLNGRFKVKDARMRELYFSIQTLLQELTIPVRFHLVRRESNSVADGLVNDALDGIDCPQDDGI